MIEFTPVSATVGGLVIGLAAGSLLLLRGRIAGVSGILGSALAQPLGEGGWRLAFLVGLPIGAAAVSLVTGSSSILKSSARIDPEVSRASMMSTPGVRTSRETL